MTSLTVSCIVPTLDAAPYAPALGEALAAQTHAPRELIVIDSESSDATEEAYAALGANVIGISRSEFNHGRVRNLGAAHASGDVLVFLTQDALPGHEDWLENLIRPIAQGKAAAAFARQIPRPDANPLEQYARTKNYPEDSYVVSAEDLSRLGIRAAFFSNSCSAISAATFRDAGGFRTDLIMNEDMLFAARILRLGHRIAYAADARVLHSHDYSLAQKFRRYFDIGVVLEQAHEELRGLSLTSSGVDYVRGLASHLVREGKGHWLPAAVAESAAKLVAVTLGRSHRRLPQGLVRTLSMHPGFWAKPHA